MHIGMTLTDHSLAADYRVCAEVSLDVPTLTLSIF